MPRLPSPRTMITWGYDKFGRRAEPATSTGSRHLSANHAPIPVIDLFAGPGGLGEGFASLRNRDGERIFRIALSIEMDEFAHRTLRLRALARQFDDVAMPDEYTTYLQDPTPSNLNALIEACPNQWARASEEAWLQELAARNSSAVSARIKQALDGAETWVLVGGPPCQAYSIVGRARRAKRLRTDDTYRSSFGEDPRHTLYRYYLDVIREFSPSVFIMENVKGMLSATVDGESVFDRIRNDLSRPGDRLEYAVDSLVKSAPDGDWRRLTPGDYVIRAEDYGVPQARHRVILFGSKAGVNSSAAQLSASPRRTTVEQALTGLPPLASVVSSRLGAASQDRTAILKEAIELMSGDGLKSVRDRAERAVIQVEKGHLASHANHTLHNPLNGWYGTTPGGQPLNHEARSHMASDLQRYLFCASFATVRGRSPVLADFPKALLPAHKNVEAGQASGHFADRFRVQLAKHPSKTITSHIAKDGHYYIHPDPTQCRSLSVREAARLQTFPDDYFFEGNRTQQYHQVGNAVPPFLAQQIAGVVAECLGATNAAVVQPDYPDDRPTLA